MNSNARRKVRRKVDRLVKASKMSSADAEKVAQMLAEDATVDVTDEGEIVIPKRNAVPKSSGGVATKSKSKVVDPEKLKKQILRLKEIVDIRTKQRESGRKNAQGDVHVARTEGYKKPLAKKEAKLNEIEGA